MLYPKAFMIMFKNLQQQPQQQQQQQKIVSRMHNDNFANYHYQVIYRYIRESVIT